MSARIPLKISARRVPGEGETARRHLVEHDPQREQVAPRVQPLSARLLRGHVRHRPQRRSRSRQELRRRDLRAHDLVHHLGRHLGQAEVQELRLSAVGDEHVRGLEVPVEDPRRMGRLQRIRELRPKLQHPVDGQRPFRHHGLQRPALHPLHGDEGLPFVLAEVVHDADVRMVERGGRLRLTLETLQRLPAHHRVRQELQRDLPAEVQVLRLVHHPHPAAPQLGEDAVVRDRLADHVSSSWPERAVTTPGGPRDGPGAVSRRGWPRPPGCAERRSPGSARRRGLRFPRRS